MRKKFLFSILAALPLMLNTAFGVSASVTVNFNSGSHTLTDLSNVLLSGGTTADGNGDVLQLGYYSAATVGSPFAGTFIALSGQGSANNATILNSSPSETFNQTSIGDINTSANGDGTFALALTFITGDPNSGNNLPSVGTPLSIRFFNATTIGAATQSNAVSDVAWTWPTAGFPATPLNISLTDPGLQWLDGPSSAFKTIPEPSTYAFLALGLPLFLSRVRRKLLPA